MSNKLFNPFQSEALFSFEDYLKNEQEEKDNIKRKNVLGDIYERCNLEAIQDEDIEKYFNELKNCYRSSSCNIEFEEFKNICKNKKIPSCDFNVNDIHYKRNCKHQKDIREKLFNIIGSPSIVLDDITFYILAKNLGGNRHKVFMKSKTQDGKERFFVYYRSISEGGFYRLCGYTVQGNIDYHLFKGKVDYVSQTFVNIVLQDFINQNIDFVDNIEVDCPFINYYIDNNTTLEKIIEDPDRIYKDEIFSRISKIKCGFLFLEKYKEVYNNLVEISNYLLSDSRFTDKESTQFLVKLIGPTEMGTIIENQQWISYMDDITKAKTSRIYFQKCINDYKKHISENLFGIYKKIYDFLSMYLSERLAFSMLTLAKKLTDWKFVSKENNFEFNGVIYSKQLRSKIDKNVYILIYMIYDFYILEDNGKKLIAKEFIIPLYLTIDEKKLTNEFGIYKKYVPAGIFICKMLEYTYLCDLISNNCISQHYDFIGSNINSLEFLQKLKNITKEDMIESSK